MDRDTRSGGTQRKADTSAVAATLPLLRHAIVPNGAVRDPHWRTEEADGTGWAFHIAGESAAIVGAKATGASTRYVLARRCVQALLPLCTLSRKEAGKGWIAVEIRVAAVRVGMAGHSVGTADTEVVLTAVTLHAVIASPAQASWKSVHTVGQVLIAILTRFAKEIGLASLVTALTIANFVCASSVDTGLIQGTVSMFVAADSATPILAPFAKRACLVSAATGNAECRPAYGARGAFVIDIVGATGRRLAVAVQAAPVRRAFLAIVAGHHTGTLEAGAATGAVHVRATGRGQGAVAKGWYALGCCAELPANGACRARVRIAVAIDAASAAGETKIVGSTALRAALTGCT